jgi:broad specificity phosphatase PhoE
LAKKGTETVQNLSSSTVTFAQETVANIKKKVGPPLKKFHEFRKKSLPEKGEDIEKFRNDTREKWIKRFQGWLQRDEERTQKRIEEGKRLAQKLAKEEEVRSAGPTTVAQTTKDGHSEYARRW